MQSMGVSLKNNLSNDILITFEKKKKKKWSAKK